VTLRFQIKNTLMHYFPEVKDVQAVDMADDEDVFKDKG
jgi:Fe-S cluster biogenesis protein NfuA